jgi:uncharacterized membrane protein YeaQ/YmgE (transglycosylase-associated protein family)
MQLAVAALFITPFLVAILLCILTASYAGTSDRKAAIANMLIGVFGAAVGAIVGLQVYSRSHGPENAFLYLVPCAIVGAVVLIGLARSLRWCIQSVRRRFQ